MNNQVPWGLEPGTFTLIVWSLYRLRYSSEVILNEALMIFVTNIKYNNQLTNFKKINFKI